MTEVRLTETVAGVVPRVLVTSALPYVNNIPHLGNVVGSTLGADVYARYLRMIGRRVLYLCGSDCYGTTSEIKARQEGLTCREVCEKYHEIHKAVYSWFNIGFDIFGTTMTDTQTEITHEVFIGLYRNGHIEARDLDQMYCPTCDLYLADRYLQGVCYHDGCRGSGTRVVANGDQCDKCGNLIDPFEFKEVWCSLCQGVPERRRSRHLYLKLADFHDQLRDHFLGAEAGGAHLTDNARAITKALLDGKLESRCITRNLKWGTPVPQHPDFPELAEFKDMVFYVWFDAPLGYLSILKRGLRDHAHEGEWLEWLKGDTVYTFGVDNVPFHTVIYPATLLGSNPEKYPLPTHINCTNYLDYQGKKFSKSRGVGIFGDDVVKISERLEIDEDYWRYYLMRIRPETGDASFNWEEFYHLTRSDLSYKIGNLMNRCVAMSYKYYPPTDAEENVITFRYEWPCPTDFDDVKGIVDDYHKAFSRFKFRDALACVIRLAEFGNGFIQKYTLWTLCRETPAEGSATLGTACYVIRILIELMTPFMPRKAERLKTNFIADADLNDMEHSRAGTIRVTNTGYGLPFPQMNPEIIKELATKALAGI